MSKLGFCAPCAAANPLPFALGQVPQQSSGLGDWYSELKQHLRPMAPWIIGVSLIVGFAGWTAGKTYCSNVFLAREAITKKRRRKRKKRRKKRK